MPQLPKLPGCSNCPIATIGKGRCSPGGSPTNTDVYVLGSTPNRITVTSGNYTAFSDPTGFMYKNIVADVKKRKPHYAKLLLKYHHAAHCFDQEMNTAVIHQCSSLVKNDIFNSKAKVVLALGADAMKVLDIKGTVGAARGQTHVLYLGNQEIPVVCSFAPGSLRKKENSGQLPSAQNDIQKALDIAAFGKRVRVPISELTKNYIICKTPEEFEKMVDTALSYPADLPDGSKGDPSLNLLGLDVETAVENNKYSAVNTWVPGFKLIAISVSWGKGLSGAVVLDHRENPYPYEDYEPALKRLLESPNPKTFHNWKYECKVLEKAYPYYVENVKFDSQMGEYLLEENKAGSYGLKDVTKYRVPDFYGYEQMLRSPMLDAQNEIEESTTTLVDVTSRLKELKAANRIRRVLIKEINAQKKGLNKRKPEDKSKLEKLEAEKTVHNELIASNKKLIDALSEEKDRLKGNVTNAKEVIEEQKEMSFEDMDLDTMLLYNAIDSDVTRQISKQQIAEIKSTSPGLFNVLLNVMLPATRVLAEMEHVGVKMDLEYMEELRVHFEKVIEEAKSNVFAELGREINLNSAQALIDVLTSDYGVKLTKKTKKGQFSTDSSVMEELAKKHPVAKLILDYKKAYKARHTFLKGLLVGGKSPHDYGCSIDGRIHSNFNQTVASTGRLSASQPNAQNIPAYILGKNIKKMFIPDDPETQVIVQVDYSAAEIRVLVAYAPDKKLIEVLNSGMCMHSYVASKVFKGKGIFNTPGVTYDEVKNRESLMESNPKEYERLNAMRQISKMVVFLTIYGGTDETLKSNLMDSGIDLPLSDCTNIINSLLSEFPAIKVYMANMKNLVNTKGEVTTHFGRKRRFPIARFDFKLKRAAYREAINAPIQGTSSDIVLHQMTELWNEFNKLGYTKIIRGTVHDSIFFQFDKDKLHVLLPLLDRHIKDSVNEHFPWMPVKFEFDVEYGPSYGEAKTNLKD